MDTSASGEAGTEEQAKGLPVYEGTAQMDGAALSSRLGESLRDRKRREVSEGVITVAGQPVMVRGWMKPLLINSRKSLASDMRLWQTTSLECCPSWQPSCCMHSPAKPERIYIRPCC